jgi:60 kDa SS-A/Ro ribonucleoprotein
MGVQALRMNLNTLLRHSVLDDPEMVAYVANRIADASEIERARQFPYQYLAAYLNADARLPAQVREALGVAAEFACGIVPAMPGPIVVGVDVSGSMSSPATGYRTPGSTSKVRCVDVAALFAAAIIRRNPGSLIVPFDDRIHRFTANPQDGILELARRLASYGGGGTDCSLPLQAANNQHRATRYAGCVIVSDNMSWIGEGRHGTTAVLEQWERFVENQTRLENATPTTPRLVCIDIQPYGTTQAPESGNVLNVGGFSDAVFEVVAGFLAGDDDRFVAAVEAIEV